MIGLLIKTIKNRKLAYLFIKTIFNKSYLPIAADLHVSKYCNISCSHCYADLESVKRVGEPSTLEMKTRIDEVAKLGVMWIRLLGGEPLIRDDIGELIDYIKLKGLFCEINTNGILIPKRLDEIRKCDTVCISLDGGREEHEAVRGKDTWESVIKGVEAAIGAGVYPRLHCVLTKHSLNSIETMNSIAKKYNLRFNFGEHVPMGNHDANLKLTYEEGKMFYQKYLNAKKSGMRIGNSRSSIQAMLQWPHQNTLEISYQEVKDRPELGKIFPECTNGKKKMFIDIDGSLYTCPRRWKNGVNYKDVGMENAWKSAYQSRDCYVCKQMGVVERGHIFSGNIKTIISSFFGYV